MHVEEVKTITGHKAYVYSLLLLHDKRVASCSDDETIMIHDPSNVYHCDDVINRYTQNIYSICELSDGAIVSSSWENSITIGDHTIDNNDNYFICKVIPLPCDRLASCSADHTIKIWKSNPPYSDTPIKVLVGHTNCVWSLLYIHERDIMISGSNDRTIRLWNMSTYQMVTAIEGVGCGWTNALYQVDGERVITGGSGAFSMVDIEKCVVEKTIEDKAFRLVCCFIKLGDNRNIVCGCENGNFCFYDMNTGEYKITRYNHNSIISDLLLIDDSTFISCSQDKTIKVWKCYK